MYLVCGEALFDFFARSPESTPTGQVDFKAIAGGSPFNVAVGLRRLGVDTALFAGLSTDYLGQRLKQVLVNEGVSTRYLHDLDAPTTLAMVALDANGSPAYSFRGEGCADRQLHAHHLPLLGPEVRGVHVGSFSLVVQPVGDTLLALVKRESGQRLISLDPNVRLNPEPDIERWRQRIKELIPYADVIKVSDEDLELLYPGQDAQQIARSRTWAAFGARQPGGGSRYRGRGGYLPGRSDCMVDRAWAGLDRRHTGPECGATGRPARLRQPCRSPDLQ